MNTLNVVEAVFFAALEKDTPAARAAYLDQACNGDSGLRRCVERLLNAHPKADSFLQAPAPGLPATGAQPPIAERPGSVLGPYKLLQQLGEGGFGVVFLAEQTAPVRRKVALKIIKPGMDSKQVIARFEAERQALALMDHPNIARVLDAGMTKEDPDGVNPGRPYFVMELVKGVPITEFCDQNRLTPRERLELFVPVCQAVQHAHQKGVIHRDLKPSNVLVTLYDDKPVPKVIDFGVAKAIEQRLTEQTLFTTVGQVVGTLEYMSPEQASLNALDVDTRSDVYALGVLLYELLTGSTPLDKERLRGSAFVEMLRLIREEEPPLPSMRLSQSGHGLPLLAAYRKTESQKLPKLVRGELDWIAMKALEKDRGRRYATASALAADVQHYLKDEAVEACPPSTGYRMRKFARKHRNPLLTAAACFVLLLLGTVLSAWQAVRATRAETAAVAERDETEKARLAEAAQREAAVTSEQKAQRERDDAQTARDELRRTHYAVSLSLIPAAWGADNVGRVVELLDQQRPGRGEEDLRNFEWHYWNRLCHAERRTLTLDGGSNFMALTLSGDGTRIAGMAMVPDANKKATWFLTVRDAATGREVLSWPRKVVGPSFANSMALSRDGGRLAFFTGQFPSFSTNQDGFSPEEQQVVVVDIASGKELFARNGISAGRLVFSPDGKRLATLALQTTKGTTTRLHVWDVANPHREPTVMEGGGARLQQDFQFSPDGTRLAAVSIGAPGIAKGSGIAVLPEIRIWDTATGKIQARIAGEDTKFRFTSVAFSPDGSRLAGVGSARDVSTLGVNAAAWHTCLWNGAAGEELKLLRSTPMTFVGTTPKLAFSPDGRCLAVWTATMGSTAVRILDAATGAERQVLKGHVARVDSVAFSADGTRLFTAGDSMGFSTRSGPTVKEWDMPTTDGPGPDPVLPTVLPRRPAVITVRSPNGDRKARYAPRRPGEEGRSEVTICDSAGKELLIFREHTTPVQSVSFSPDGRLVVSRASNDVKIWEAESGKVRWASTSEAAVRGGPQDVILPMSLSRRTFPLFSSDGRVLALLESDGVKVVAAGDFRELFALGKVTSVIFSPDGRRLIAFSPAARNTKEGPAQSEMKLWDVDAGREIMSAPLNLPPLLVSLGRGVIFSHDSRFFAAPARGSSMDLTVWDAVTGQLRVTLKGAGGTLPMGFMLFSPDGTRLVSSASPNPVTSVVTVWDLATGKVLYRLHGHSGRVVSVVFSPDAKRIASTSYLPGQSSQVKLWDAASGRELLSLKPGVVQFGGTLSFSPDGHRLTLRGPAARQGGGPGPAAGPGGGLAALQQVEGLTALPSSAREIVWDATPLPEERGAAVKAP